MDAHLFIEWFSGLPPQVATFLIAMIPVTELRASIPIALTIYDLPVWQAIVFSVLGDLIPALFILFLVAPASDWCSKKSKLCHRFWQWVFARTDRKFAKKHAQYGALALMVFVGIPLPLTGSWTGSVAAWLFGIPKKLALPFILGGIILASIIVTVITLGADSIYDWIRVII